MSTILGEKKITELITTWNRSFSLIEPTLTLSRAQMGGGRPQCPLHAYIRFLIARVGVCVVTHPHMMMGARV